jgi:hypothetical protein
MVTPEAVLNLLREQVGRCSALKAGEIVEMLTNQRSTQSQERQLREIFNALCLEGWPICSSSYHGYWWAESAEEIKETCESLRGRAMSSLTRISKLKRLAIPLLEGQLLLPIEMAQSQIPEVAWQSHHPALSRIVDIPDGLDRRIQAFIERSGMEQDEFFVNAIVMYLEHLKSHG